MKILWVSHSGGSLGAERVMVEGIRGLRDLGVDVDVVLPTGPVDKLWHDLSVPFTQFRLTPWVGPSGRISHRQRLGALRHIVMNTRSLARHAKQGRYDLLVTNTLVTPVAALAAKLASIGHVWYVHEFGDRDHGLEFAFGAQVSQRLMNRLSDRIIVNSIAVRDNFARHIRPDKSRLLYCAVETPPPIPKAVRDGPVQLLIVGGLSPAKRQEDAIRAVAIVKSRGLEAKLTIVGPSYSSYKDELLRLTAQLGVEDLVHFAGPSDSPFHHFAAADATLMCSRDEAFGRVTVEAMKMGTPVIGANSGGTAGLIRDGFNGLLYEPADPEDLAGKIERVAREPLLFHDMGRNAQTWAREQFSKEKFSADLVRVFSEALVSSTARRSRPETAS